MSYTEITSAQACLKYIDFTMYVMHLKFFFNYSYYSFLRLKHYKVFLPGYTLHQAMEIHPTYNGQPNTDNCCHEYLFSKIETAERICSKLGEQVHMVNNELYDMHIPSDMLNGWKIM